MDWYVLFVETGREEFVREWIKRHVLSCRCITPKRRLFEKRKGRVNKVERLMFPGYVFVNLTMSVDYYQRLTEIPHLLRVLGRDGESFTNVPKSQIDPILRLIDDDEIVDYSILLAEGTNVKVISGPLMGMETRIVKVDKRKGRAKVLFEIAGSIKLIDLGVEVLERVS